MARVPARLPPGRGRRALLLERLPHAARAPRLRLEALVPRARQGRAQEPARGHRASSSPTTAPYGVGDDLRYVDWNIYGRLDRLYLKLFVDEEDLCLHLLLDALGLHGLRRRRPSSSTPSRLAAALASSGSSTSSGSGVACSASASPRAGSPRAGATRSCRSWSSSPALRPAAAPALNDGLAQYALARAKDAGLAVVISDLLDPAGYERGLRALLERRFDVHVVHLLAPDEMNPVLGGDLRPGRRRDGRGARAHRGRRGAARATGSGCGTFLDPASRASAGRRRSSYHRVVTDTPVEEFVLRQLKGVLLGMSFLSAAGAFLLLALSVPLLLLYFLKVRRQRAARVLEPPALGRRRSATARPRRFFQRLQRDPLLLLQLLALLLALTLALARPTLTRPGAGGQAGDRRARQLGVHEGATTSGPSRFAQAQRAGARPGRGGSARAPRSW